MDSRELIDAQFDRAVEIVQSLPKNGPIQTDYEEKLTMYRFVILLSQSVPRVPDLVASIISLYKQGAHAPLNQRLRILIICSNRWKCHHAEARYLGHARPG
jgi:hypothetical protein